MTKEIRRTTPDEQVVIDELNAIRESPELGMSHAEFHRLYLSGSYSSWHRINHHQYTGDTSAVVARYRRDLNRLKEMMDVRAATSQQHEPPARPYFLNATASAIVEELKIAFKRTDERRLVIMLAQPGQGKSAMTAYLKREFNATCLLGQESWRKSYSAVMLDVGRAFGLRGTWHTRRMMEHAVYGKLREKRQLLAIDEGNCFGPAACNAVRDLMNKTQVVIFLTAIPEFLERLLNRRSFKEAEQMRRRAIAIIEAQPVSAVEVEQFLAPFQLNGDMREACREVAAAARIFGHYDMVVRIAENLSEAGYREKPADVVAVRHAIACEQARLRITSGYIEKVKKAAQS